MSSFLYSVRTHGQWNLTPDWQDALIGSQAPMHLTANQEARRSRAQHWRQQQPMKGKSGLKDHSSLGVRAVGLRHFCFAGGDGLRGVFLFEAPFLPLQSEGSDSGVSGFQVVRGFGASVSGSALGAQGFGASAPVQAEDSGNRVEAVPALLVRKLVSVWRDEPYLDLCKLEIETSIQRVYGSPASQMLSPCLSLGLCRRPIRIPAVFVKSSQTMPTSAFEEVVFQTQPSTRGVPKMRGPNMNPK